MPQRVTLRAIAAAASVDVSTVSLALRGNPRIPARTAERIRKLADDLGYQPDPSLSHLAAHRWIGKRPAHTATVAYLAPRGTSADRLDDDPYFLGVRQQASRLGYQVDVFNPKHYPDDHHLSQVLYHRGIRGVVVGQTTVLDRIHRLEWDKFCVVQAGLNVETEVLTLVRCDLEAAVRGAFDHAVAAGYRNILFLFIANPGTASDRICLQTAEHIAAHPASGLVIKLIPETWEMIYQKRTQLLQKTRQLKPDCVIQITPFLFDEWIKLGARIPQEFAAVCIFTQTTSPFYAGMDLQAERVGSLAVDILDIKLRRFEFGLPPTRVTMMVEPQWVPGPSLPPASAPSTASAVAHSSAPTGRRGGRRSK